jgi:hypothetical protein
MCIRSSDCRTQTGLRCSTRAAISRRQGIFFTARTRNPGAPVSKFRRRVPPQDLPHESEVETAIESRLLTEAADAGRELRETMRKAWQGLLFALLVVAGLVFLAHWLEVLGIRRFCHYLGESLIIIGWVTRWSPAQLLLFDHFLIRRRRNLARALARSHVVL